MYPDYFQLEASAQLPLFEDDTGITVEDSQTPPHAAGTWEYYTEQYDEGTVEFDVGQMDMIWPGHFAANGWSAPLDERENRTDGMVEMQVGAVTVDGQLRAMPLFTDANLLIYHEAKLKEYGYDERPETESELVAIAKEILEEDDQIENGFLWQGGQNEGLIIMWLKGLWARGGSVWDSDEVVVDTVAAHFGNDSGGGKHELDRSQERAVIDDVDTTRGDGWIRE